MSSLFELGTEASFKHLVRSCHNPEFDVTGNFEQDSTCNSSYYSLSVVSVFLSTHLMGIPLFGIILCLRFCISGPRRLKTDALRDDLHDSLARNFIDCSEKGYLQLTD